MLNHEYKIASSRKATDIRCIGTELFLIPVQTRVPLKFGHEVLTSVTCVRARVTVEDRAGERASGWGETPLSVQWVWPSELPYEGRHQALLSLCTKIAGEWARFNYYGHPLEIGYLFQRTRLLEILKAANAERTRSESIPWLAALVCCSMLDIAIHDAYGVLHHTPTYGTYNPQYMNQDLSAFLAPSEDSEISFAGLYPRDFLNRERRETLPAWHLVGGLDRIGAPENAASSEDGYPNDLADWIKRDGLKCLKIKLKGNDQAADLQRILDIGKVAIENSIEWLSTDFNCTVKKADYVNEILDQLLGEHPRIYGMILYVEQPFPYELDAHRIDAHSLSARKPLFLDESAHDWQMVKLGRALGWTGVALKTCKTQSGALLSACFARAHGMSLMVQDLTNPMLAMIPHALLAAHVPTIMGVETNAPQFYPDASLPEAKVHAGLYRRRGGQINLSTLSGPGFGYRVSEIIRDLGEPMVVFGDLLY